MSFNHAASNTLHCLRIGLASVALPFFFSSRSVESGLGALLQGILDTPARLR